MKKSIIVASALTAALMLGSVLPLPAAAVQAHSYATTTSVTVTVDGLNVRKSASANSSITGSLDKGAVIKITQTKKDARGNTWGKLDSGKGWVNLRYTSTGGGNSGNSGNSGNQSSGSGYKVKVSTELNVRKGAGTGNAVVDNLAAGSVVTIVAEKKDSRGNTWGQLSNGKGWINLKYTSKTGQSGDSTQEQSGKSVSYTVKVSCDLNVRKGAGSSNGLVTTLSKNSKVSIVEEKKDSRGNTWGKLADGSGWINLKYTDKSSQSDNSGQQQQQNTGSTGNYNVKVTTELNVRRGVGTSYGVIDNLPEGKVVTIVATQKDSRGNTWGQLSTGGWINLKYTSKTNQSGSGQNNQSGTSVNYTVKLTSSLNVRKGAGTGTNIVTTLSKNARVTIVAEQKDSSGNKWGKLADGSGWINLKYTSKVNTGTQPQQPTEQPTQSQDGSQHVGTSYKVKVVDGVNIRKEASGSSDIVDALGDGTVVTIVEEVRFGGRAVWGKLSDGRGWISLRYTTPA